jgi:hypothetical protein
MALAGGSAGPTDEEADARRATDSDSVLIKSKEDMINPESSDPKDPETNTWWVWIPIFITLVILFGTLVFERDFLFEGQVRTTSVTRTA